MRGVGQAIGRLVAFLRQHCEQHAGNPRSWKPEQLRDARRNGEHPARIDGAAVVNADRDLPAILQICDARDRWKLQRGMCPGQRLRIKRLAIGRKALMG